MLLNSENGICNSFKILNSLFFPSLSLMNCFAPIVESMLWRLKFMMPKALGEMKSVA